MPLTIKHAKTSLKPDTGDSTMLQPSDWNAEHVINGYNIITEDTTFDIKADGSGSYPTLKDCIDYIRTVDISQTATITINLDAGVHLQSAAIVDSHPHEKIFIRGAAPVDVTVTAATVSGTTYDYSVVYTLSGNVPAGIVPGMVFVFHNNGVDHTTGYLHFGAHEITAVGVNTVTVKNRGNVSPQTISSQSIACKIIKSVVKSTFTTSALWQVTQKRGYWGNPYIKDIAINGDDKVWALLYLYHGAVVHLYPGSDKQYCVVLINSASSNLVVTEKSSVSAQGGTIVSSSAAYSGIYIDNDSLGDFGSYTIVTGCNRSSSDTWYYGVVTVSGSYVVALNMICVNNKLTAKADFVGRGRITASIRNHAWSSTAITAFNSGVIVSG
jgi:hypothetical protein